MKKIKPMNFCEALTWCMAHPDQRLMASQKCCHCSSDHRQMYGMDGGIYFSSTGYPGVGWSLEGRDIYLNLKTNTTFTIIKTSFETELPSPIEEALTSINFGCNKAQVRQLTQAFVVAFEPRKTPLKKKVTK